MSVELAQRSSYDEIIDFSPLRSSRENHKCEEYKDYNRSTLWGKNDWTRPDQSTLIGNTKFIKFISYFKALTLKEPTILYVKRCVGGTTGGNCWESGGHHSVDPDPPKEFRLLEDFLIAYLPQVQLKDFIDIKKACIKVKGYTEYEYYGNSYMYEVTYLDLVLLYNELIRIDLLDALLAMPKVAFELQIDDEY